MQTFRERTWRGWLLAVGLALTIAAVGALNADTVATSMVHPGFLNGNNLWTGSNQFSQPILLPDGSPCTTYSLRSSTQATQGFALGASGFFWCEAGSGGRLRSDGISVGTGSYQFATGAGSAADLKLTRGGAGLLGITDADGTPALNLNVSGAPGLSTCGDGALATGSSNTSGRVVGTTQTACTLTFSVSFGGNSADCWIANLIANRGFVSAASSTAFTVSGLTAGDDFMYFCVGR